MSIDISTDYTRYPTFAPIPGLAKPKPKSYHQYWMERTKKDIISIVVTRKSIYILNQDSKVITFDSDWGQYRQPYCKWRKIEAIAGGYDHVLALSTDGTIYSAGDNSYSQRELQHWPKIVSIAAGGYHTIGVCSDGSVRAAGYNKYGQCDVRDWTDIIDVQSSKYHTVGLRSDGTVLATGRNDHGQCNVQSWSDIISIAVGDLHTVGLRADGTVLATGCSRNGRCNVEGWSDITVIAAGKSHTVALSRADEVLTVGSNAGGKCRIIRYIEYWKKKDGVKSAWINKIGAGTDYTVVIANALERYGPDTIISNSELISSTLVDAVNFRD